MLRTTKRTRLFKSLEFNHPKPKPIVKRAGTCLKILNLNEFLRCLNLGDSPEESDPDKTMPMRYGDSSIPETPSKALLVLNFAIFAPCIIRQFIMTTICKMH